MKKLLLLLIFLSSLASHSQTEQEKTESTITKNEIEGHIYFLADDLLKGRGTATPENKIAASYLANTLRGYGVKPVSAEGSYYQKIKLNKIIPPTRLTLNLDGEEFKNKIAVKAENTNFSGKAMYLGYGLEEDYKNKNVSGKIIIIKAGAPNTKDIRSAYGLISQKYQLAQKHNAVGIVEFIDTNQATWGYIDHFANNERLEIATKETSNEPKKSVGYLWVHDKDGVHTAQLKATENIKAEIKIAGTAKTTVYSQNVVGILEGSDPKLKDEFIIYSGHYDHVGIGSPDATGDTIYNGARDNAVGVTTVLSMAENIAKYPTKRSALFILFTGEEKGLLGSQYYVENPVLPLEKMVYCFNSDNAGYNDTSLIALIGLKRTTGEAHIQTAANTFGLTALGDMAPEQGLFDRSDNVSFAKKGIPAPTFGLGFRTFDGDVTKHYHQPSDEADSLDYDYLLKFFKAYVLAGRLIANDPVTPTWTAGDKYEAAAKKLYKN